MQIEELSILIFTAGNALRIAAYFPQIWRAATDPNGASAISYSSWTMFMAAHLSTVVYAVVNVSDWTLATWFGFNALFCAVIIGVAEWNRRKHRRTARKETPAMPSVAFVRSGSSAFPRAM